jgi:hypothetical protein
LPATLYGHFTQAIYRNRPVHHHRTRAPEATVASPPHRNFENPQQAPPHPRCTTHAPALLPTRPPPPQCTVWVQAQEEEEAEEEEEEQDEKVMEEEEEVEVEEEEA